MIISCSRDARGKSCQCSGPHPRAALSSLQESQPFSSMQEHRIQEHETLWGFCGKWQRGEPRFPGEALTALQTQLGFAGPCARHPPPDLPLTHSLSSHKPLQHPNAFAPFKAFLSTVRPQRRLRGFREITFFLSLPLSSLLRDIFNAFIILKGLLECKVQDDTFRSR